MEPASWLRPFCLTASHARSGPAAECGGAVGGTLSTFTVLVHSPVITPGPMPRQHRKGVERVAGYSLAVDRSGHADRGLCSRYGFMPGKGDCIAPIYASSRGRSMHRPRQRPTSRCQETFSPATQSPRRCFPRSLSGSIQQRVMASPTRWSTFRLQPQVDMARVVEHSFMARKPLQEEKPGARSYSTLPDAVVHVTSTNTSRQRPLIL
jgi:hypothetical protein